MNNYTQEESKYIKKTIFIFILSILSAVGLVLHHQLTGLNGQYDITPYSHGVNSVNYPYLSHLLTSYISYSSPILSLVYFLITKDTWKARKLKGIGRAVFSGLFLLAALSLTAYYLYYFTLMEVTTANRIIRSLTESVIGFVLFNIVIVTPVLIILPQLLCLMIYGLLKSR